MNPTGAEHFMPLISVIVPIYNVERYLPDCLESIRRQSFADFECICVDDGSPDNCAEIVAKYAEQDPRFRLIRQENQGVAGARNKGIDEASGDFLFFVDSDDFVHIRALELLYTMAQEKSADYVCGSFRSVSEDCDPDHLIFAPLENGGRMAFVSLSPLNDWLDGTYDNGVDAWMRLYRRELFDSVRFIPDMKIGEDAYVCPLILSRSKKAVFVQEVLYYYRDRKGSLMRLESYLESLTSLARNGELGVGLSKRLSLSRRRRNVLLRHCGMGCFAMVAMDLVLNVTLPRRDWLQLLQEARELFRTLKRNGIFKYSMVVAMPNRIALFTALELKSPSLFRIFYRMVWPRQWKKRVQSARSAGR